MKLTIVTTIEIEIDQTRLETYANEAKSRFDLPKDSSINMVDIVYQAGLDGDIDLPEAWELDNNEWEDDLTPDDITDLMNGEG